MNKWSINSNGHDFIGYFEQDCSEHKWNGTYFEAKSWKSINMHQHFKMDNKTKYKILSIGPSPNTTYFENSCNSNYLYSWIMKSENFETQVNSSQPSNTVLPSKFSKVKQLYGQANGRVVFFSQPNFRGKK